MNKKRWGAVFVFNREHHHAIHECQDYVLYDWESREGIIAEAKFRLGTLSEGQRDTLGRVIIFQYDLPRDVDEGEERMRIFSKIECV